MPGYEVPPGSFRQAIEGIRVDNLLLLGHCTGILPLFTRHT